MSKRHDLKSVVAERGQVTIPKVLRDRLGIGPGTILTFELRGRELVAKKDLGGDPLAEAYGCLKGRSRYKRTDDYINEIRGVAE